ncbi:MAG: hypothetical protein C4547_04460 [Phycisphaerales bacterium]|nr:MAG: hypothetical protein C4547_04460 [Phycisphaerales bacterium]
MSISSIRKSIGVTIPVIWTALLPATDAAFAGRDALNGCLVTETEKIVSGSGEALDLFGWGVAIDGLVAVVGAPGDTIQGVPAGAAYVFIYDGRGWFEQARLQPFDVRALDDFGHALAVDAQTRTILIGSDGHDVGARDAGAAYVYVQEDGHWGWTFKVQASDVAPDAHFGWSVALDGDRAAVGAYGASTGGPDIGAAYVFRGARDDWVEEARLTASDGKQGDWFGFWVDIEGDVVLAGAPRDDDNGRDSGSAYVFEYVGQRWREVEKLVPPDGHAQANFGDAVAISGATLLVGAPGDSEAGNNAGAVYVYGYDGRRWRLTQKLMASDAAEWDHFGDAVSLDGDVAVVGAYWSDHNGAESGAAYVWRFDGDEFVEEAKFVASDGDAQDYFAISVGVSGDAGIAGAWFDDERGIDAGAAYLLRGLGDCNENTWLDACDIVEGRSRDGNRNGVPDECEPACSGKERITTAKCQRKRESNVLKVKLAGGLPGDTFRLRLTSGESLEGTLDDRGRAKAKIRHVLPGGGTVTAMWGCGTESRRAYECP